MRNIELLNNYIVNENLSRRDLEMITKVGQSQISLLLHGKTSWTKEVCDNLNQHFITDEFVPYVLNRETGEYIEWLPPKEPKKNTRANKYNVGDRVICLHDCKIHVVENVKFLKKRQEWVYYLDGKSDIVYENYLIEYKPKFSIGDKVIYDNDEALVVDVLFEKKSYLYSILVDNSKGRYGILVEDYELEPFVEPKETIEVFAENVTATKEEDSIISDKMEQAKKEIEEMTKVVTEMHNIVREDMKGDTAVDEVVTEELTTEIPKIEPNDLHKYMNSDRRALQDGKDALKKIILGIVDDLLKLI